MVLPGSGCRPENAMQRMLVTLVVILTAAVGVLGIATYNLSSAMDAQGSRRAPRRRAGARPGSDDAREAERMLTMERQIAELTTELKRLRDRPPQVIKVPGEGSARVPDASSSGDGPYAGGSGVLSGADHPRDAEGEFLLTDEDEALFLALQRRVQERQRIDGMTRNIIRRVERLASRGEIGALDDHKKAELEPIIQRYVVAGDHLVSRFVREPTEDIQSLTAEQRRDMIQNERDVLVEKAVLEMAPLLGDADALKVAEESLQNPWGLRFGRNRRGAADRRGN